jgi:NADH:ubiquinone oxidoreductase subunit 6 (subunit J)
MADNWGLILPVVLGLAGVYLLLPRARGYPPLWGAAASGLALVLSGVLLVRAGGFNPETVLFYAFAAVAVVAGGLLVTQRNPVHAALSFALVVLSTCGLFLLQAAPFLMAATIIVYAGAIVVTFLFVIMLAQQAGTSDADHRSREPLLATVAGFVLLGTLLYLLNLTYDTSALDGLLRRTEQAKALLDGIAQQPGAEQRSQQEVQATVGDLGPLFTGYAAEVARLGDQPERARLKDALLQARQAWSNENVVVERLRDSLANLQDRAREARAGYGALQPHGNQPERFSTFSGPAANKPLHQLTRDDQGRPLLPAENVAYLGRSLFSDYLLAVELGGTLLLVATIGAIAIAARRAEGLR